MDNLLPLLTEALGKKHDLSAGEAAAAARLMAEAQVPGADKKAFLLALAEKGETVQEVTAFAATFRDLALEPGVERWAGTAIDIVGTGGDRSGSFNISTFVCFVVAAAGVTVLKHGNRSITSKSGSADLLNAFGIPLESDAGMIERSLHELNFAFFFAPAFHPAFKEIMPVRKELAAEGRRTIFNVLGPLINPGRPAWQLLGVYAERWVSPLARVLGSLGLERGLVVHAAGADGAVMDELSCAGRNRVCGLGGLSGIDGWWTPEDCGLVPCPAAELAGGSVEENVRLARELAAGGGPAGLRETTAFNAGAALYIARRAESVKDGIEQARETMNGPALTHWLEKAANCFAP